MSISLTRGHLPRPSTCQGRAGAQTGTWTCTHPPPPACSSPRACHFHRPQRKHGCPAASGTEKETSRLKLELEATLHRARPTVELPPSLLPGQGRRIPELYLRTHPSLPRCRSSPTSRPPALRSRVSTREAPPAERLQRTDLPLQPPAGSSALYFYPPRAPASLLPWRPPRAPAAANWSYPKSGRCRLARAETRPRRRAWRRAVWRANA